MKQIPANDRREQFIFENDQEDNEYNENFEK
jgi:hypothetical protein